MGKSDDDPLLPAIHQGTELMKAEAESMGKPDDDPLLPAIHQGTELMKAEAESMGKPDDDPLLPIKALMRIAIDSISYHKAIFPNTYFEDKLFLHTERNKVLLPVDSQSEMLLDWMEQGLNNALQNKFLKTFVCSIYEKENDAIVEDYYFSFFYHEGAIEEKVEVKITCTNYKEGKTAILSNSAGYNSDQMRTSDCKMIRTLVSFLTSLDNLSLERTIILKLIYNDGVTPEDYVPPFFKFHAEDNVNIKAGTGNIKYHAFAFKVKSFSSLNNDGSANSRVGGMSLEDYRSSDIEVSDAKILQTNLTPVEGNQINIDDLLYMKVLYHALRMDHVTINKLHSMLDGKARKLTVRKWINKMVDDGFLSSIDRGIGKPVIHSEATKSKLIELRRVLDNNRGKEDKDFMTEQPKIQPKCQINGTKKKLKDVRIKGNSEEQLTNKLRLSFDGTPKEAKKNFRRYCKQVKRWFYSKGRRANAKSILGRNKKVYTTPESGPLEVEVTHESDCVTFVIEARHGWLRGYRIGNDEYELKPDEGEESYMTHPKKKTLSFRGNHRVISGGNPGALEIGLYKFRKSLRSLIEKGDRPDPLDIGRFVLCLCEAPKFKPVLDKMCQSFDDSGPSRLDMDADWMNDLLHNWSSYSADIMAHLDCLHRGKTPQPLKCKKVPWMDSIEKCVENVRILHLNAYTFGLFSQSETDAEKNTRKKESERISKKQRSDLSYKRELRPYDSARKRSMSTGCETEVNSYGGRDLKPVQGLQLACYAEIVEAEGGVCLQESQTLSHPRLADKNLNVPSRTVCKFITRGAIKTLHQFDVEGNSIYMNQAKIVHTQGIACILPSQTHSRPRWVCNNMKMPTGALCNFISLDKSAEVTETTQEFKRKGSFITKSYTAINQTTMLHPEGTIRSQENIKISHTRWANSYMPAVMQPTGNIIIRSKMKPDKIINQIEHHEWLPLNRLKPQKCSKWTLINQHVSSLSFTRKGKTAGFIGNTSLKNEGGFKTMSYKKINQPQIGCVQHWPGSPFLQKAAFNRRIWYSARTVRFLVAILRNSAR